MRGGRLSLSPLLDVGLTTCFSGDIILGDDTWLLLVLLLLLVLPEFLFFLLFGSCTLHLSHPLEPLVDEIVANVGGLSFVILPTSPAGRRRT